MNEIVLDARLNNGIQVCVWRDIDNAVWEVEVIDEKTANESLQVLKDARGVLEYLAFIQTL